jgi:hypothetical protein
LYRHFRQTEIARIRIAGTIVTPGLTEVDLIVVEAAVANVTFMATVALTGTVVAMVTDALLLVHPELTALHKRSWPWPKPFALASLRLVANLPILLLV